MNNFVIIHDTTSQFVTETGSKYSYSDYLEEARLYPTLDAAKADCCGNEHVGEIDHLLGMD